MSDKEKTLTKAQIEAYQKQQIEDFLRRFNEFLEAEDFNLVSVPLIDVEGRIRAEIRVVPK